MAMGDAEKNGDQNLPIDDQNRPLNVQENLNVDQQPLNVDHQNQVQNPNLDRAEDYEEEEDDMEDAEKKEDGDSEEEEDNQDSTADNFEGGVDAAAELKVEDVVSSVEVKMEEAAGVKVEKTEAEVPPAAAELKVEDVVSSLEVKVEEAVEVKVKIPRVAISRGSEMRREEEEPADRRRMLNVTVEEGLRSSFLQKKDALWLTKKLSRPFVVVDMFSDEVYLMKFLELENRYCIGGEWETFVRDKGVQVGDLVCFSKHKVPGRLYIFKHDL